jgi:glycine cleavage system H protein
MAIVRGCEFPEELYYWVEKHIWVQPMAEGLARVGLTAVAYHQLRNTLTAISLKTGSIGQETPKGRSIAMVESLKYIGALSAPFAGVLVRANESVAADPDAAAADPYGAGWIAEMRPTDWEAAKADLLTGAAAVAAYQALLEAQQLGCE